MIKKFLVTCALPYANGDIHLGHILEHVQADIWVRYKKMIGYEVYFICADDAHGTPIMLKAKKIGIHPEKIIAQSITMHKRDFCTFNINHDNYHSTHSQENLSLLYLIYDRLKKNGLINNNFVSQLYDKEKEMFLPDRFVKGDCPRCKSTNQYGDNCEVCGAVYNSKDLLNPVSLISQSIPITRKSKHFFFNLPVFTDILKTWINSAFSQKQVVNKMQEWFNLGLKEWNISRDKPYFGFKIPDTTDKYFYVWMDATIGYISSFKNLCNKNSNIKFESFWNKNASNEIYQFIGKDIIYFHSLFWPAILEGSNFKKPTKLFVHGHLTINGLKMSKSKGNFIKAKTWLKYLDSDSLRYYYASKLSLKIDDIDLNLLDFIQKINSDIVNKIVNLASRTAKFINEKFSGMLSDKVSAPDLYEKFVKFSFQINDDFNNLAFNKVIQKVIFLTDLANSYIDIESPWKLSKTINIKKLQDVCSMGLNLFRIIMIFLKPIVPDLSLKAENFLNTTLTWKSIHYPLINHKISNFKKLYSRIKFDNIKFILQNK